MRIFNKFMLHYMKYLKHFWYVHLISFTKFKAMILNITLSISVLCLIPQWAWGWSESGGVWSNQSIAYEVNTRSSQELGESATLNIINASYQSWSTPECTRLSVNFTGVTTGSWTSGDERNTHVWIYQRNERPLELSGRETIGVTLGLYRGTIMLDGDILYNGIDHTWTTNPRNQEDIDAQSIITHEIGHQLGLGHSESAQASMYASYLGGIGARSLSADDITGICTLYPHSQNDNCGSTRDCESDQRCIQGQCVSITEAEGQVGDDCSFTECVDNLVCVQTEIQSPFCTLICEVGDCPTAWTCQTVRSNEGNINLCLPREGDQIGQSEFGDECESGPDCLSGLCVDDGSDVFCTEVCGRDADCPQAAFCAALEGGGGACIPNQSTPSDELATFGERCDSSQECMSNLCIDDGEVAYCTEFCDLDIDCPNGSVCYPLEEGEGACIIEDINPATQAVGYGESCSEVIICESALCINDGQSQFCSEYCELDQECPSDSACVALNTGEGVCIPTDSASVNDRLPNGSLCEFSDDCQSDVCVAEDGRNFICVPACQSNTDCTMGPCEMLDEEDGYCRDWNVNDQVAGAESTTQAQPLPEDEDQSSGRLDHERMIEDESDSADLSQGCLQSNRSTRSHESFYLLILILWVVRNKNIWRNKVAIL